MAGFLRDLSPFRALFLLVFLVSLCVGLYAGLRGGSATGVDGAGYEPMARAAMRDVAPDFAERLFVIEEVGISLIERCELAIGKGESAVEPLFRSLLADAVASAPDGVDGVGLRAAGENGVPGVSVFLPKTGADMPALPPGRQVDEAREAIDTAREINLERSLAWTLAANGDGRVSTILLVSSRERNDAFDGESIVHADLSWLTKILGTLENKGVRHPAFVTPHNETIWLADGRLRFAPVGGQAASTRTPTSGGKIIEFDLLGSGWRLVAESPTGGNLFAAALIAALVALAALVLEPRLRGDVREESDSARHVGTAASPGLLSSLGSALLKYRITNPDQERIDSELRVARKIQFSLLPAVFPSASKWREYDLYALLRPAREIGGDYYDFFALSADRFVIVVGDVSGKGMPAALYMAVCRTAFRALAAQADNPGQLLSNVNDMLVRDNKSGLYVTLACFFIDMPTGKCEYAIGGHPAPLWRRAGERGGELLDHPRETFVGMKAGVNYPVGDIRLSPGDTLLLFTDGVTEARGSSGEELEQTGLYAMFDKAAVDANCQEIVERLDADLASFTGGGEQTDDMTLLAFRYWGPGGMRMSGASRRSSVRQVLKTSPGAQAEEEK